MTTEAGERYGEFELLRLIATGGMAEIYLAKHEGFGGFTRNVVVKRMLPQLAVRSDFVQMFLDEARLAANLNHPNIVQVFNLGEVEDTQGKSFYIAMEFVDGPHLGSLFAHSLRQRKPLPIELCAYIVARAADGLHYAHEQSDPATGARLNIVHRDISPQNVLVSRDGDVKVTDFGVAKASTQQTKTRTGIIKGKVAYMSPEQCLGEVVDKRTDVFALGIVLYELLTRRRLFRDKSDLLIMQKITGEDVHAPSSVNKELDAEIDAICQRALARTREARFSNAGELAEALDAWLAGRNVGDSRAQLVRWFEQNASELTIDNGTGSGSVPGISSASVAARTPPGEATAATPSLNSAETVSRASASRPAMKPGVRSEAKLPSRTNAASVGIEDELTQRAPRSAVDPEATMQSPASGPDGALSTSMASAWAAAQSSVKPGDDAAEFTSVQRSSAVSVDGGIPEPALPGARRSMLAVAAGAAVVVVLAVVAVLMLGHGSANAVATDAGVLLTTTPTPPVIPPPDGEKAKLVLTSEPAVELLVDGKSVGKAPQTLEHAPGHVKVQAVFDDQAPGTEELDVVAGEEKTVRVVAKVPLVVKSTPPGARVRIDGGEVEGLTPLTRPARIAPGVPVKVRVELFGYGPEEVTATADTGKPLDVDVKLEKTTSAVPIHITPPPPAPAKPGTLKMRSVPWVNVKVQSNGYKFSTPGAVQVPAGRQVLVLSNPESKLIDQLTVVVPEDRELRVDLVYEQVGGIWKLKKKEIR